ncbi:MAG TPA: LuxR C-terminal-related transcriptional regulator [Actinomycetes bacterium]|nr:LuxR C-terminal-related transcriptional regulator [Actinomycetes bacterium]
MDRGASRRALGAVDEVCRTATTPTELHRGLARVLSAAVPFDRWCGLTFDPETGLPTGGYHAEGFPMELMPRLLELEYGAVWDVGRLAEVARADSPVSILSRATADDPARSARFRDVIEPAGLRHEMRVVHRRGDVSWGALVLARSGDLADFTPAETAFMETVAPRVAAALQRVTVLVEDGEPVEKDTPGVVTLTVDDAGVAVASGTPTARQWMGAIDDAMLDEVPIAVASLARTAVVREGPVRCRLRARTGRWLTLHAERLSDGTVSVVIEPSRPSDVASILGEAYRLTAREREIVGLVVRGFSNAEIARRLWLSPYTVADHLKSVFEKTGVGSRGELTSRLFFGHYLPRADGAALADGKAPERAAHGKG